MIGMTNDVLVDIFLTMLKIDLVLPPIQNAQLKRRRCIVSINKKFYPLQSQKTVKIE